MEEVPPFSDEYVGTTEGWILHFSLLWLLSDALLSIAVLLFSVLLRCMEEVWVISVSAAYKIVVFWFGFFPFLQRVSALLLPS